MSMDGPHRPTRAAPGTGTARQPRRGFGPDDDRQQLDTAIDWGRYAELCD